MDFKSGKLEQCWSTCWTHLVTNKARCMALLCCHTTRLVNYVINNKVQTKHDMSGNFSFFIQPFDPGVAFIMTLLPETFAPEVFPRMPTTCIAVQVIPHHFTWG